MVLEYSRRAIATEKRIPPFFSQASYPGGCTYDFFDSHLLDYTVFPQKALNAFLCDPIYWFFTIHAELVLRAPGAHFIITDSSTSMPIELYHIHTLYIYHTYDNKRRYARMCYVYTDNTSVLYAVASSQYLQISMWTCYRTCVLYCRM